MFDYKTIGSLLDNYNHIRREEYHQITLKYKQMPMFITNGRSQFLHYTNIGSLVFEREGFLSLGSNPCWFEIDILLVGIEFSLYFEAFLEGDGQWYWLIDVGSCYLFLFDWYFFDYVWGNYLKE